jgi:hypothetical protein
VVAEGSLVQTGSGSYSVDKRISGAGDNREDDRNLNAMRRKSTVKNSFIPGKREPINYAGRPPTQETQGYNYG